MPKSADKRQTTHGQTADARIVLERVELSETFEMGIVVNLDHNGEDRQFDIRKARRFERDYRGNPAKSARQIAID